MRPIKRLLLSAAAVGLLAAPDASQAQATPQAVMEAGAQLSAEIQAAGAAGREPPRLSDQAAAPTIRAAFDVSVLDEIRGASMDQIFPVCQAAANPMMAYLAFDEAAEAAGDRSASAIKAERPEKELASIRFQDELTLALRFTLRCLGTAIPGFENLADAMPVSRRALLPQNGLTGMREGGVQTYAGLFEFAMDSRYRAANRELLLDEGIAQAQVYARMLDRRSRANVIAAIDAHLTAGTEPSARVRLEAIKEAMVVTECGVLCSL